MPNYKRYSELHNEIMTRLGNGEITTEHARDVIDLAFNKYISESSDDSTKNTLTFKNIKVKNNNNNVDIDIIKKGLKILNRKWNEVMDSTIQDYLDYMDDCASNDPNFTVMTKDELKSKLKLSFIHINGYFEKQDVLTISVCIEPGKSIDGDHVHTKYVNIKLSNGSINCETSMWDG